MLCRKTTKDWTLRCKEAESLDQSLWAQLHRVWASIVVTIVSPPFSRSYSSSLLFEYSIVVPYELYGWGKVPELHRMLRIMELYNFRLCSTVCRRCIAQLAISNTFALYFHRLSRPKAVPSGQSINQSINQGLPCVAEGVRTFNRGTVNCRTVKRGHISMRTLSRVSFNRGHIIAAYACSIIRKCWKGRVSISSIC